MPNHIMNLVTIKGDKEDIKKFVDENINAFVDVDGDVVNFTFQTICPRPISLDIESSSRAEDAMKYVAMTEEEKTDYITKHSWLNTEKKIKEFETLGKTALANQQVYGATDWYDWDIRHWGTKWDCYEVKVDKNETAVYLEFQTAWSTPMPIYEKIAAKYKNLSIQVKYADEDLGSNCGELCFEDGSLLSDVERDYRFACEVWDYDYREDEDD